MAPLPGWDTRSPRWRIITKEGEQAAADSGVCELAIQFLSHKKQEMKSGASPSQCRQTRMLKLSQASPNVAARSQVVGPGKATLVYLGRLSALWWLRESAFLISQGISDKGLGVAPTSTGSVPYPCEPGRICGMQLTEPENARCRGFMHAQHRHHPCGEEI